MPGHPSARAYGNLLIADINRAVSGQAPGTRTHRVSGRRNSREIALLLRQSSPRFTATADQRCSQRSPLLRGSSRDLWFLASATPPHFTRKKRNLVVTTAGSSQNRFSFKAIRDTTGLYILPSSFLALLVRVNAAVSRETHPRCTGPAFVSATIDF